MTFRGWPVEALEFYEGLEADNSKTYFTARKAVYEQQVRAPMEALLRELEPEFGAGRIYRPYRDVRFSPDKSPYKTAIGASLDDGGYVQLSAHGLAAGCGRYLMAPDQLARFRAAVADDDTGAALDLLTAALRGQQIEVTARDRLRTAPKGFPRDHPRAELLRLKGLIAWREWPAAAWLGTAAAKQRIVTFLRAASPLRDWLDKHVGSGRP